MKLINDIVNDAVNSERSITSALLKTKVLANQIGNDELLSWVSKEISGYKSEDSLPYYRTSSCEFIGDYRNGREIVSKQLIPLNQLDKSYVTNISKVEIFDSIGSIEEILKHNQDKLIIGVNIQTRLKIENSIIALGNPHFRFLELHRTVPLTFTPNIIISVRNKLLDFVLELQKRFGLETEINELINNQNIIQNIMHNTITSGDGSNVTVGNHNNIKSHNTINKGRKNELAEHLRNNNLPEKDIKELLNVIDLEAPVNSNQFGPKVSAWIASKFAKAVDGSWQITIGAAGTLLAEAIQQYYGL